MSLRVYDLAHARAGDHAYELHGTLHRYRCSGADCKVTLTPQPSRTSYLPRAASTTLRSGSHSPAGSRLPMARPSG